MIKERRLQLPRGVEDDFWQRIHTLSAYETAGEQSFLQTNLRSKESAPCALLANEVKQSIAGSDAADDGHALAPENHATSAGPVMEEDGETEMESLL